MQHWVVKAEKLIRVRRFPGFIPTQELRRRIGQEVVEDGMIIQKLGPKSE